MGWPSRMDVAGEVAAEFHRRERRNLVAVGVFGSVARGDDRRFSDIDLLAIVRRKHAGIQSHVRQGVLVTVHVLTPGEAREEVEGAGPWLNDTLAGWRSMRALHDPVRLIARLKVRARRIPDSQFVESARRDLREAYEDHGKLRNAISVRDLPEAREMALWFSGAAAGTLLDLEGHVLRTGRRALIEVRRHGELGRLIWELRYEARSLRRIARLSDAVWEGLVERCRRKGLSEPGIAEPVTTPRSVRSGPRGPSRGR